MIHDVPRDGIFINGKLNVAEYNEVRNSMLYTADNAAIALRQHDVHQAVQDRGNVLRYNRLLDTVGYGSYPHCTHPSEGFASPFCSFGIYLDSSISGVTVYGNTIARCGGNSLFIQFGGGNVVQNNIFVEGDAKHVQFDSMIFFGTFMFSDSEKKYHEPPNEIRHNIFSYGGPDTKLYQVGPWDNAAHWNQQQAVFEDNLIWRQGRPVTVWMHEKMDCKSLAQWQARGHDTRSLPADPLFVDAAKDDYRLRPDSPAYKIGFKDINAQIEKIGAYPSGERRAGRLPTPCSSVKRPWSSSSPGAGADDRRLRAHARRVVAGEDAGCRRIAFQRIGLRRRGQGRPPQSQVHRRPGTQKALGTARLLQSELPPRQDPFCRRHHEQRAGPANFYMEFRDWAKEPLVGPDSA